MINANYAIMLSGALFAVGLGGLLTRRNLVLVFISIEIMLNAAVLNLVALSRFSGGDLLRAASADAVALLVLFVAACEAAVGLGILLGIHRLHGSVDADKIENMKE